MWQYPTLPLELSNPSLMDDFLIPYRQEKSPLLDYARGGVALLDASQGMNVKNWTCEVQEDGVYISSTGVPLMKVETLVGEPSWISMCFDQNMHYNLAYLIEGQGAFWYWYDATQQRYVTISLGNVKTPIARFDDVRMKSAVYTDIVLSYIKGTSLCVRLQRDRYGVEYTLASNAGTRIIQCGMHRKLRFQWICI